MQPTLTITKHELEELAQLADRITDVLPIGVNAVAAVILIKANSADSQMSVLLNRMEKLETRLFRGHRPRGILLQKSLKITIGEQVLLISSTL